MKKNFLLAVFLLLIMGSVSHAAVYEASTLHNAVSRSETVQGLFTKKWDDLMEKNFYFDISGTINWVYGFDVNTWNAGSKKYEATDLNLVRTYGSMVFAIPFGSPGEGNELMPFMLAFTTTGFHYGLTKTIDIERENGGSETITDYKHSQFFDDIYALSFLWRPYVYFHAGIITNKEYQPDADGKMDYANPLNSKTRGFISSNVLSVLGLQVNATEKEVDSFGTTVEVTNLVGLFSEDAKKNTYIPAVTLGYGYRSEYNDEDCDSVWVVTGDAPVDDEEKDTAKLHIFDLLVTQKITDNFNFDVFAAMQYISQDIYAKNDAEKIDPSLMKEFYCMLNYKIMYDSASFVKIYTGASWYWDPAIAIHRESGTGDSVWGFILGCDANFVSYGFEAKVVYDYSSELKKLVETTNKVSFEGSAFYRI